jgi:hypothetical protein
MTEDSRVNESADLSAVFFGWGITPPSPFHYRSSVVSGEFKDAQVQAAVQAAKRAAEDDAMMLNGRGEDEGNRLLERDWRKRLLRSRSWWAASSAPCHAGTRSTTPWLPKWPTPGPTRRC